MLAQGLCGDEFISMTRLNVLDWLKSFHAPASPAEFSQ